ncbi:unnamed protein product [Paramecium primaurelia]|uniref:Uncharacterized protein n=1 Tax=Paramecium primaurelia TaxID=5886 RepID=A0A8S1K127_PARPR|nr:unnamed protein product [Paramecium primaurelia]
MNNIKRKIFFIKIQLQLIQIKSFFPSIFLHNISQRNLIIKYIQGVEIVTKRLSRKSVFTSNFLFQKHLNEIVLISIINIINILTGEKMMIKFIFEKIEDFKFNELLYNLRQSKKELVIVNNFQTPLFPFIRRNVQSSETIWLIMNVEQKNNQDNSKFKDQVLRKRREEINNISQYSHIGESVPQINKTE